MHPTRPMEAFMCTGDNGKNFETQENDRGDLLPIAQ